MFSKFQITEYISNIVKDYVKEGDCCIDATAGNGNDTLLLCRLSGKNGIVHAFDIQKTALENTEALLAENCCSALLHLSSHSEMYKYAEEGSVSCIMFNFGYLPGGDHNIHTNAESSIEAIKQGLKLLKTGGIMTLCIYSGRDSGFEEKQALMEYLKTIDYKKYLVITMMYYNRPNDPPVPVVIQRIK